MHVETSLSTILISRKTRSVNCGRLSVLMVQSSALTVPMPPATSAMHCVCEYLCFTVIS